MFQVVSPHSPIRILSIAKLLKIGKIQQSFQIDINALSEIVCTLKMIFIAGIDEKCFIPSYTVE
jgi:hypothetical protein